jgi:hypothetical protein
LTIQFGGFADRDYSLTSRGRRLYERALTVDADKVVLIGWPINSSDEPTSDLDLVRRDLQKFGVRHRYHDTPEACDPDSYMVIGNLLSDVDGEALDKCVRRCRATMADQRSMVRITGQNTYLATYIETRMPGQSTTSIPLNDVV